MTLDDLVKTKKISRFEYLTYLVFTGDDAGKEYLKLRETQSFMEEPTVMSGESICFHDGRRSVWREIIKIIDVVENYLENNYE